MITDLTMKSMKSTKKIRILLFLPQRSPRTQSFGVTVNGQQLAVNSFGVRGCGFFFGANWVCLFTVVFGGRGFYHETHEIHEKDTDFVLD